MILVAINIRYNPMRICAGVPSGRGRQQ